MKALWNSDSYDKFLLPVFKVKPLWETSLLNDFISYKSSQFGTIPAIFGKDDVYTEPNSIVSSRLYHIHLMTGESDRKGKNKQNWTSNSALVYTKHIKADDVYSLLAIFPTNAHSFARNNVIMKELASYANKFHKNPNP
ncbi:toxin YafO [Brenneria goodwinii]|uniref:Toxin YafO n=1 Tax=Brenneria goodwinii TaxID=1109412 RepID=A0AAE8ENK9_9GAMM|nr:type II toxin-antitoxin system YafO family toxin [Brenneria goodwinii]ATA22830.1 toxin YafO [Brenneria goodwinii]RLM15753.1 toxin YafO [Brenneria goodwinii]